WVSAEVPNARVDVRQLENGDSVGLPVALRISGEDADLLRVTAARVAKVLRNIPLVTRVRDNWGEDRFTVKLNVDPDRANMAGISHHDIADASTAAIIGNTLTTLRDGDKQIPVVGRLRANEMSELDDVNNLYVSSKTGKQKIPLREVAR